MSELQLEVSSEWTESEHMLGKGPPLDEINYVPWGTRSLKIHVSSDRKKGLVRVRPEPVSQDAELIASYTHEGEELQFSWGGGWEQGVEVEHKKGESNYVFFNATHLGDNAADQYTTDIVARDKGGQELARLKVTLSKPAKVFPGLLKPNWRQVDANTSELKLEPATAGQMAVVPFYQSRWWPQAWTNYVEFPDPGSPPEITLRCQRDAGKGYSQVEVFGRHAGDPEEILLATIDGDLEFPLVDLRQISADLSYMAGHWNLRVWFWWLDKGVAKKLEGKVTPKELKSLDDWGVVQEIPDAERVDLVFNHRFKMKFVCTDLHWHELWAPCDEDEPIRASIAGTSRYQVYFRGAGGLKVVVGSQARSYVPTPDEHFDPSRKVMAQLRAPGGIHLAAGSMAHKHTPYFHDLDFETDLTSSDVRHG